MKKATTTEKGQEQLESLHGSFLENIVSVYVHLI